MILVKTTNTEVKIEFTAENLRMELAALMREIDKQTEITYEQMEEIIKFLKEIKNERR